MKQVRRRLSQEESDIIQALRLGEITISDAEMLEANVKMAKSKQRYQDLNRVERKTFREYARLENALTEYNKELIDLVRDEGLKIKTVCHSSKKDDTVIDRKSTRLNSSHTDISRMPSSA